MVASGIELYRAEIGTKALTVKQVRRWNGLETEKRESYVCLENASACGVRRNQESGN